VSAGRAGPTPSATAGALLLVYLVGALVVWLRSPPHGIDDAHIFYRYAENLAAGRGFVFNPGGERVEGVTSLSWVAILTGAVRLGLPVDAVARALGVLCGAATVVLSYFLGLRVLGSRRAAACAGLALALDPGFLVWSAASGMESALYALLATGLLLAALGGRPGTTAALALLAALTRPEGIALWLPTVALLRRRGRHPSGRLAAPLAVAALVLGLVFAARVGYFGHPLPNTYYAKVHGLHLRALAEGVVYCLGMATRYHLILAAALVGAVGALRAGRGEGAVVATGAFVATGFGTYALAGGDHFAAWRHLHYGYPALVVLAAAGLVRGARACGGLDAGGDLSRRTARVAGLVIVLWAAGNRSLLGALDLELDLAARGREEGAYLRDWAPPGVRVGVLLAGALPHASGVQCFDLLGLNSTAVAHAAKPRFGHGPKNHESFDRETFFRVAPEIVWHGLEVAGGRCAPHAVEQMLMQGLPDDPRFEALYEPRLLTLPGGRSHAFFARRDLELESSVPCAAAD